MSREGRNQDEGINATWRCASPIVKGLFAVGPRSRDRVPYLVSAAIHALALALAFWASILDPTMVPDPVTYSIDLVSPPATAPEPVERPSEPAEEFIVERTELPPQVEGNRAVVAAEPEDARVEISVQPETPTNESSASETAEINTVGEDIRVRMDGLQRDYPEYYETIIRQIGRCHRWNGPTNLEAQVGFVIRRDGTIDDSETDITRPSGNVLYDFSVMGAVECVGSGRLGPLPEELPYDQLSVWFNLGVGD